MNCVPIENLMRLSKPESALKLGDWFTSISHGFRSSSIMMSKPRIWKQSWFSRSSGWQDLYRCDRLGCEQIRVLTMISLMSFLSFL